jgi:hypothetical protein
VDRAYFDRTRFSHFWRDRLARVLRHACNPAARLCARVRVFDPAAGLEAVATMLPAPENVALEGAP